MRLGKLTNEQLERLVLGKLKHTRSEVVCSPRVGVDCAAVELGGRLAVLSTDPITAATNDLGKLTVHISCNDAAAAGAEPIGLLVTLLVPPSATEDDIDRFSNALSAAAGEADVEIIGGHTEVTDSVTRMITCATVIAKAGENGLVTPGGMKPGDDVILTKHAGLEGTAVIAAEFSELLGGLSEAELAEAKECISCVSVVKEGIYASHHGATAMHDVTEGGVLGAAWEMADASGCGIVIDEGAIPVRPITRKICSMLGLDPLRLLSSGSMLIACGDGAALVAGLKEMGVNAAVIGRAGAAHTALSNGTEIAAPGADELYKLFADR